MHALGRALFVVLVSGAPIVVAIVALALFRMPGAAQFAVAAGAVTLSVASFFALLDRHRYAIRGNALYVHSLGGARKIPLSQVVEVTKVKRTGRDGHALEQVLVTYENRRGERDTASLSSSDPVALLHQIVSHCPHLTGYDQGRAMRQGGTSELLKEE